MTSVWYGSVLAALAVACSDPGVREGADFDDPDLKADGASRPRGMYQLVDPDAVIGDARIDVVDLREDDTYFDAEEVPADSGGGIDIGFVESFGTVRITKDRFGNHYLRFRDELPPNATWRWRFTPHHSSAELEVFLAGSDDVAFTLARSPRPDQAFIADVEAAYAGAAPRTPIADPAPFPPDAALPQVLPARVRELRIADPIRADTIAASSMIVDDVMVFVLEWGPLAERQVEIFDAASQLVTRVAP